MEKKRDDLVKVGVGIVLVFVALTHETKHLPEWTYHLHPSLTPQIAEVSTATFL